MTTWGRIKCVPRSLTLVIQDNLKSEYKMRRNLRPVKFAYFIRDSDATGLRKAILLSGTQWGGIRNLIIPVDSQDHIEPFSNRVLKICEPEYLVSAIEETGSYPTRSHIQKLLEKLWPGRSVGIHIYDQFIRHDPSIHAIRALPSESLHNSLRIYSFTGSTLDRLMMLALFGSIYPGQHKYYRDHFELDPLKLSIKDNYLWERQYDYNLFSSVLNLTGFNINPHTVAGGMGELRFDVLIANSIASICTFWNLRALNESTRFPSEEGRRTFLMPSQLLKDTKALETLYDFVRPRSIKPGLRTNLHVSFRVPDEASFEELRDALGRIPEFVELRSRTISTQHKWSRKSGQASYRIPKRLSYLISRPVHHVSIPDSFQEGVLYEQPLWTSVQPGKNDLLIQPPQTFNNPDYVNCILDLESPLWEMYPKRQSVANAIHPQCRFSRYGLTIDVAFSNRPSYLAITLPTEWEALQLYFGDYGYEASLSSDGSNAMSFVNLLGGLDNLGSLLQTGLYHLLNSLTPRNPPKLAQYIVQYLGLEASASPDLLEKITDAIKDSDVVLEFSRKPKTANELRTYLKTTNNLDVDIRQLLASLQELVRLGVLKRGYSISCPTCKTSHWHAISSLNETIICPGCLSAFTLPLFDGSGELRWHYQLNSLVSHLMDRDGLPSLLALHHLGREQQTYCRMPSLLLQPKYGSGRSVELDFVFVSKQELSAGECKVGATLETKDIERARFASELGIKHFYFCTLQEFDAASSERIASLTQELSKQGTQVKVLTGHELLAPSLPSR
jgi:hypothetical protein